MSLFTDDLETVVNLTFSLMTGKTVGHYRQPFQALKNGVSQTLRPRYMVYAFELSLMTAIEMKFQTSRVYRCVFHFCKSLYRKIQDVELRRLYKRDFQFRLTKKNICLCVTYRCLWFDIRFRRLMRTYPRLDELIGYLRRTDFDGNFPPRIWNCHSGTRIARTNNYIESK
jgi:hypothetical protein